MSRLERRRHWGRVLLCFGAGFGFALALHVFDMTSASNAGLYVPLAERLWTGVGLLAAWSLGIVGAILLD